MKRIIFTTLLIIHGIFVVHSQDLVIDSIIFDNEVIASTYVSIQFYCSNIDTVDASYSRQYYFLSRDATPDFFDWNIGYRNYSSIAANSQQTWTASINTTDIPTGDYYIICVADYREEVDETNENNNILVEPLSIVESPHDLIISHVEIDTNIIESNGNIKGRFSVKNIGSEKVRGQFYNRMYISDDTIFGNDYYITNYYVSDSIDVNDSDTIDFNRNIQHLNLKEGSIIYVAFQADNYQYIPESNENNNVSFSTEGAYIELKPDLYGSDLIVPASAAVGSKFRFSYNLHTSTDEDIGNIMVRAYISDDNIISNNDVLISEENKYLGTDSVSSEVSSDNLTYIEAGDYYLILSIDEYNNLNEKNENNNILVSSLFTITSTITDLKIDSVRTPLDTIYAGNYEYFSIGISYSGADTLDDVYYTAVLSTDSVLDPFDIYCNYYSFNSNGINTYYDPSENYYVSPNITPGYYYLLLVVDYDYRGRSFIPEINENNNMYGVRVYLENSPVPDYDLNIHTFYLYNRTSFMKNQGYSLYYYYNNLSPNPTPDNAYTTIYASHDSVIDSSDIQLTFSNTSSWVDNSDYQFYTYITIPWNIDTGSYYLIATINSFGRFSESNYDNNILISEQIQILSYPDDFETLELTTDQDTIYSGQSFYVNYLLRNNSDISLIDNGSNYVNFAIYLSENNQYDVFDEYLSGINYWEFTAHDSITGQRNININDVESGSYYLIGYIDRYENYREIDEANNFFILPIEIVIPDVDIEITDVDIPDEIPSPSTQYPTLYVRNNGSEDSPTIYIQYYISETSEFDPYWSQNIYNGNFDPVEANSTSETSHSISIPDNIPIGYHYLHIIADRNNNINETNEENNIYTQLVYIAESTVDFSIATMEFNNDTILYDESITTYVRLLNSGNTYVYNTRIAAYASTDDELDGSDYYIGNYWIYFNQGQDTSDLRSFSFNPPDFIPGKYYIIIQADYQETYDETDEDNNVEALPFVIDVLDIDIELVTAQMTDDTVVLNKYSYFNFTLTNNGHDASSYFYVGYYLSEDSILDDYDYFISSYSFNNVQFGDTLNRTPGIRLSDVPEGNFYLILYADYRKDIYEEDENNNFYAIPITIIKDNVDLLISNLSITSDTILSGSNINITYDVLNIGTRSSDGCYLRIYFSNDDILDIDDKMIYDQYIAGIAALSYRSYNTQTAFSAENSGTYYMILKVDYQNNIIETDETNNVSSKMIYIDESDIDLVTTTLTASDDTISNSSYIYIYTTTENQGTDDCGRFDNVYYISTDTILDFLDYTARTRSVYSISAGGTYNYNASIYVSNSYSAGDYYIIHQTDNNNKIAETNESNNIKYVKFTIEGTPVAKPDMTYNYITLQDSTFNIGDDFRYSVDIRTDIAIPRYTYLGFYYSHDSILDQNDTRFYNRFIGPFTDSVVSTNNQVNFSVDNVILGENYLIIVIDVYNYVIESKESNNIRSIKVTIEEPQIDVITSDISYTGDFMAGNEIQTSMTVSNIGNPQDASFVNRLVLSKDTIYDLLDKQLVPSYWTYLYTSQLNYTAIRNVILPNISTGDYYLINICDHNSWIYEYNETNNISYLPVTLEPNNKDITISNLTADRTQSKPGDTIRLIFDVLTTDVGKIEDNFNCGVYLSEDPELSIFDQLLENVYLDSLSPDYPKHIEITINTPEQQGKYYIIVYVDNNSQIAEFDETNNTSSLQIMTKYPHPNNITENYNIPVEIFPNPADDIVNIWFGSNIEKSIVVSVIDLSGKTAIIESIDNIIDNTTTSIDISGLSKGIYFIKIINTDKEVIKKLIVK